MFVGSFYEDIGFCLEDLVIYHIDVIMIFVVAFCHEDLCVCEDFVSLESWLNWILVGRIWFGGSWLYDLGWRILL